MLLCFNGILVECGSRVVELQFCDIIYIEAIKGEHRVEIVTSDKKLTVRQSLKRLHGQLPDQFYYANKSCIINLSKVKEVDEKNRYLTLEGERCCEISFRRIRNLHGYLAEDKEAAQHGDDIK